MSWIVMLASGVTFCLLFAWLITVLLGKQRQPGVSRSQANVEAIARGDFDAIKFDLVGGGYSPGQVDAVIQAFRQQCEEKSRIDDVAVLSNDSLEPVEEELWQR